MAAKRTQPHTTMPNTTMPHVGWREWVTLPGLEIPRMKAKVDTGARTSALHAFNLNRFTERGVPMVEFEVHPLQRKSDPSVTVTAEVVEDREVRPSSGIAELRPVVLMDVELGGTTWTVEVTLTNRDAMGFRMLLGRSAIRGRFLVDPGRSYLAGRKTRRKSKAKAKK